MDGHPVRCRRRRRTIPDLDEGSTPTRKGCSGAGAPAILAKIESRTQGSGELGLEHKDHDKVFFATFGAVLAALGAIFFICIVAARAIAPEPALDPEALAKLEERIRPVGSAVTDPAALVKVAAKAAREPYTGEQVLEKYCNACHMAGVMGAPKEDDKAAWSARASAAGGLDGLTASAIKGKNAMPPRGGGADLSDDEVKAAVETMLKKSGV